MFDPSSLHGIIPPLCTPMSADGEVDVQSVHSLVEYLVGNGVHGLFPLGSTGEFAGLTSRQRFTLLQVTTAACRGRVPVLAGILDTSTSRCIENSLMAKEAGADVLVLASVFYLRPGQKEIIEHFRAVRAATELPIMAYDVPSAVNVKLEAGTIKALYDEGLICGMKDSSGNIDIFRHILMLTRGGRFRAFTGSELLVDTCLHMGAHGSVPGLGNVFPAEYVRIYDLAQAGDWQSAAALQERLMACFWELIRQGDPSYGPTASALGGFKTGLKLKGAIAGTRVAAPIHSFTPDEEARVADVMQRHGFL